MCLNNNTVKPGNTGLCSHFSNKKKVLYYYGVDKNSKLHFSFDLVGKGGGGGALPYLAWTCMRFCGDHGMVFRFPDISDGQAVSCLEQGDFLDL